MSAEYWTRCGIGMAVLSVSSVLGRTLLPGERLVLEIGEALAYIFRVFGRAGQAILPQGWNAFTARP